MQTYTVERVRPDRTPRELSIDTFPWDQDGYRPVTTVELGYTSTALTVRFQVEEPVVQVRCTQANGAVHKDSCVEFFVNPHPGKDSRYLNLEVNCIGVMHAAIGDRREGRVLVPETKHSQFAIQTSLDAAAVEHYAGEGWWLSYQVPFAFLQEYYPGCVIQPGTQMRANFYKCGDETPYPHYGCWNLITSSQPDFHRPECFGELKLS